MDDPRLKSAQTMLARWQYVSAVVHEVTSSHQTLFLRLFRDYNSAFLEIRLGVIFFKGPFRWQNACISVRQVPSPDGSFRLVCYDEAASFEVMADSLEVAEYPKWKP